MLFYSFLKRISIILVMSDTVGTECIELSIFILLKFELFSPTTLTLGILNFTLFWLGISECLLRKPKN